MPIVLSEAYTLEDSLLVSKRTPLNPLCIRHHTRDFHLDLNECVAGGVDKRHHPYYLSIDLELSSIQNCIRMSYLLNRVLSSRDT